MLFNCANWPDYVVGYRRSMDILADIMLTSVTFADYTVTSFPRGKAKRPKEVDVTYKHVTINFDFKPF